MDFNIKALRYGTLTCFSNSLHASKILNVSFHSFTFQSQELAKINSKQHFGVAEKKNLTFVYKKKEKISGENFFYRDHKHGEPFRFVRGREKVAHRIHSVQSSSMFKIYRFSRFFPNSTTMLNALTMLEGCKKKFFSIHVEFKS